MKNIFQYDAELNAQVSQFLYREAELQDDHQWRKWQAECVNPSIRYVIPQRITLMKEDGAGFCADADMQDDDWNAMTMRINRFDSKAAWSENPYSRLRHFVTNVRVQHKENVDSASGNFDVTVKSNVLVYRTRGSSVHHDLISAERTDILRKSEDGLKLLRREVRLDCVVVGTPNLSFYL